MTQVIGRSELATAEFINLLAQNGGTPTVVWVVDPALSAPGAGPGPLTELAAELTAAGVQSMVASTTFPREPKISQVAARAAALRADNPMPDITIDT